MVKIAIDAMGGDFAPTEQVLGAVEALGRNKDLSVILCGDEPQIKQILSTCKYDESRVEIVHTTEVITMEEIPTKAVKTKKDSSTVVAFRLLKEDKADGLVSSGSEASGSEASGSLGSISSPTVIRYRTLPIWTLVSPSPTAVKVILVLATSVTASS